MAIGLTVTDAVGNKTTFTYNETAKKPKRTDALSTSAPGPMTMRVA